jgi:hypothetical protein
MKSTYIQELKTGENANHTPMMMKFFMIDI